MRITLILWVMSLLAFATNSRVIGMLILCFIIVCSLYGLMDSVINGSFDVSKQRKRNWRDNPELAAECFEAWKEKREARRRLRPGYLEMRTEMEELIRAKK